MNPPDVPWYVTLLLIPAAVQVWDWFRKDGWPSMKALLSVEAKAKREAQKAASSDRETRYLAAYEQVASALTDLAETNKTTAQAIKVLSDTHVVDNLTLQRIERRLDWIEGRVGAEPPAVRRRTEAEQG